MVAQRTAGTGRRTSQSCRRCSVCLALSDAAMLAYGDATDFDWLTPYVQAAMGRRDYMGAATLMSSILGNFTGLMSHAVRPAAVLTQAYTSPRCRRGRDRREEPIAPLLSAALQLRPGDQKLAFETYLANQKLFDQNRADVPIDARVRLRKPHRGRRRGEPRSRRGHAASLAHQERRGQGN